MPVPILPDFVFIIIHSSCSKMNCANNEVNSGSLTGVRAIKN
jgi:hypothetical protein